MAGLHAEKCSPEGGGGGLTRWRIEQGWQRLADTPPCVTWSLQVWEQFNGDEYGSSCTGVTSRKLRNFICLQEVFLWHSRFPFPSSTCHHWFFPCYRGLYTVNLVLVRSCTIYRHSYFWSRVGWILYIHNSVENIAYSVFIPTVLPQYETTIWTNILK